jgi:hypothetical protein
MRVQRVVWIAVATALVLATAAPVAATPDRMVGGYLTHYDNVLTPPPSADCTFAGIVRWRGYPDKDYTARVEFLKDNAVVDLRSVQVHGGDGDWTSPDITRSWDWTTSHGWAVRGSLWSVGKHPRMLKSSIDMSVSLYCG